MDMMIDHPDNTDTENAAFKYNSAPIFTITSFNLIREIKKSDVETETGDEQLERWGTINRTRCIGYYHDFELAEKVVLANSLNINEDGYYSHVVIEQVEPGLYPLDACTHRWFYKWDDNKNYVKVEDFVDPNFDVTSYAPIG
jgi:hypothetical protein